jgi:hypothetical protein
VEIGYEIFRGHSGLKDEIVLLVENCTLTNVMTGKRKWHLTARKYASDDNIHLLQLQ